MPELERLMLHELAERAEIVREAYAEFDYKTRGRDALRRS